MNKQIERILICVLWLLAATLGTCFWLNTTFGFNIFSAQHWQYLAYLQAAQTPVRPAFYVSLTCAILISLGVLYVLIRPKGMLRRRIGIGRALRPKTQKPKNQTPPTQTAPITQTTPATPAPTRPAAPNMQRPPRIATPAAAPTMHQPQPTFSPQPAAPAPSAAINFDTMREIFENAGYSVKRNPHIGNFRPAVFAIGTGETLWLGGIGIDPAPLAAAMERLGTIFSDTLDDIIINIHGFIIAPTGQTSDTNILSFADTDALREYMDAHKNTPPEDADGRENFNAYSEYIDTVINYMDKT